MNAKIGPMAGRPDRAQGVTVKQDQATSPDGSELGLDVEDDEGSAPPRVTDAPADIWLVYGELEHDDTHWNCCRDGEVSWCEDKQYDSDVHYVRGDRYDDLCTEIERLRAALAESCDEHRSDMYDTPTGGGCILLRDAVAAERENYTTLLHAYHQACVDAANRANEIQRLQRVWEDTRTQRDELLAHLTRKEPLPAWAVEWIRVYGA
jgi:hypothetical protein